MPGRGGGAPSGGTGASGGSGPSGGKGGKKQVPLRLDTALWNELAAWAEDEFRSVNGQIEYLLTEAVRQRKKGRQ